MAEPFWKTMIIEGLSHFGGEAHMTDVYQWLESVDYLGEMDLEDSPSPYQGRPKYTHFLRATASVMVQKGELIRVHPGHFRLPYLRIESWQVFRQLPRRISQIACR